MGGRDIQRRTLQAGKISKQRLQFCQRAGFAVGCVHLGSRTCDHDLVSLPVGLVHKLGSIYRLDCNRYVLCDGIPVGKWIDTKALPFEGISWQVKSAPAAVIMDALPIYRFSAEPELPQGLEHRIHLPVRVFTLLNRGENQRCCRLIGALLNECAQCSPGTNLKQNLFRVLNKLFDGLSELHRLTQLAGPVVGVDCLRLRDPIPGQTRYPRHSRSRKIHLPH